MSDTNAPNLELKFGGRLVEQLGAQMYPSATATVAELISNAWDADASNVWVEMPFGNWVGGEILVTDDGVGMDLEEAQHAYLVIGRDRRVGGKQRTESHGRLVHGRKGIGKLAAFGTATVLEVKTCKKDGAEVAFRLDYDNIRKQSPDLPYQVEQSRDSGSLSNPLTGEALAQGTRIKLSDLRLKRRLNAGQFETSMSRRFALDEHEMAVFINGQRLRRFDIDLEFRFPPGELPPEASADGNWAVETLPDGRSVRWWIGFTPKPLKDDAQQGVSVIVRGKLAQRPFKFDAGGGTTGQLGQEYLVGEVQADWIDDEDVDSTADNDYIQSNRDQLQLENQDLAVFLEWGRRRLRWALSKRDTLKRKQQSERLQDNEGLKRLLNGRTKRERTALTRVAAAVARLPEAGEQEVVRVMEAVIGAREDETTRALTHELALASGDPETFFLLLRELGELDGRSELVFIEARLAALSQLLEIDSADAVRHASDLLLLAPGLLNPHWELSRGVESGEWDYDVRLVLLEPMLDDQGRAAVVIFPIDTPDAEAAAIIEQVVRDYPDDEVVVIAANATSNPSARPWSELLSAAEHQHKQWHQLVVDRLASFPTTEP